jgi:predicted ester cyclase
MWDLIADDNSITVARVFEFYDGGSEDVLPSLVDPRYVDPQTNRGGIDGITSGREVLRATFGHEARVHVQAVIAEGDEVAVRWTLRGRHLRPFKGAPPSERPVELSALSMFRLEGGRIVQSWVEIGLPRPLDENRAR